MRALKLVGYLIALLLLIIIVALFFIDVIAKYVIEEEGTKAVKARVELESVDVRFFPLGVSLEGLKVTNPQEPMTNAFEAGLIDANVAFAPLLKSKVIVDSAALTGMRFNTARQSSGAVPGLTPPPGNEPSMLDKLKQDFKLPTFQVPDPDQLLAQADLQTVKLANELQTSIGQSKQEWNQRIDGLPDKETLEGYKQRIKALKESKDPLKRLQALKDVANIQKEVKSDLDKIKSAREDLNKEIANLKSGIAKIKAAPKQDIDKMLGMVGLDADAVQGLAKGLFGDEVAQWIGNGYAWYEKLLPYMNGGGESSAQAQPVADTTDYSDGLPKFLVKRLTLDGELPFPGEKVPFSGEFTDLTDQASVWGKPAQLALNSQAKAIGGLDFKGVLDHVVPANAKDTFNFDLKNLPLQDIVFSSREDFPVTMAKALAVVAGQAEIKGGDLDLKVDTRFLEVQMANLLAGDSAPLKQAMIDALKSVSELDVLVLATGALQDPDVKMSTSLDKIFSQSMRGLIKKEQDKLTGQLQTKLNSLVEEKTGSLNSEMGGLVDLNGLLGDRIGDFNSLL
ncbi:chromosome segregation ATPase [Hahella sp. CCB-MM4]|uniref:TIGR03545 family protein n=1 Tax=Hahella sp. (strain CCB-MM4) TaxID=1926491 RepID=UPI000B9B2136|nr:TIGR03545 family protein [Hahella sp. CCB-MM4]OZG75079.1 chromosome segregation ATPase [Hahella sp. CCB-MM4]